MVHRTRMKTSLLLLLSLSLSPIALQAAEPSRAHVLVRAMRSDEIAVASAKHAFLTGAVEERYGKVNAACVKKIPFADFTAGSTRVVETVLQPREMDSALAFFQSPAGTKYVEGLIRRLRTRQGEDSTLPKVDGKEEITAEQMAAIADFSRSDLGRKIMGKDMTESPAALAFGRDILGAIASKCGSK
jgi:hypothetical protein